MPPNRRKNRHRIADAAAKRTIILAVRKAINDRIGGGEHRRRKPMIGAGVGCPCGSGLRAARCCQMEAAALPLLGAARPLIPVIERAAALLQQNAIDEARATCLSILELAPEPARRAVAAVQIRKRAGPASAAEVAAAAHRAAASEHALGDATSSPCAVQPRRHRRGRDPCPQRGPHRAGKPAIAQSDGHDHDRGQPASDRRIPLPPGHRTDPQPRPDRCSPTSPGT